MAASASSPVSDCACFYFDSETSGLNPYCDEIIEIGIKKLVLGTDKERMEAPELSILVKPSRPISETISSLTGITNELLESDGVSVKDALDSLKRFVMRHTSSNQRIWFLGHNVIAFDKLFLEHTIATHNIHARHPFSLPPIYWMDSLPLARFGLPHMSYFKLISICRYYKTASVQKHRAIGDCHLLVSVINILLDNFYRVARKKGISVEDPKPELSHSQMCDIKSTLCI